MDGFLGLRRNMVDCQLRTYDVTDRDVLAAADAVPRESFVPASAAHLAYLDQPIPLQGRGRSLMAPMVVARMIQTLDLEPGEDALEYAGASGYGAALMQHMGAKTSMWEPDAEARRFAESALAATGMGGVSILDAEPPAGSFDAILVGGACEVQPSALFPLLRDEGRLIVVEGVGRAARVKLYQKSMEAVSGRTVFDAFAPELAEFRRPPAFTF